MPSIRLFIGEVSGRKPHIFKDRHGVWRVIPARRPMTLWEKLCDDDVIHALALAFHRDLRRYWVQKYRKSWNHFAHTQTKEWNWSIRK